MEAAWRLILDGNRDAAMNMSVDEAMLCAHSRGLVPPTLRLYGWRTPSVSLGFFQKLDRTDFDPEYCRRSGIEIVRRITGGRAVLHGHDLTFCVVAGLDRIPEQSRGVRESHRWLIAGIVEGLRSLGVDAAMGSESSGRSPAWSKADCFAHTAACDICAGDLKIAGAAQCRTGGVLMEQGSIPFSIPAVDRTLLFRNADIPAAHPMGISRESLETAIAAGMQAVLGRPFHRESLTEAEEDHALRLANEKYATEAWLARPERLSVDNRIVGTLY